MKKDVLFSVLVLAAISGGCASAGYTGLTGLSVPGFEAASVVAANQVMVWSIAQQVFVPWASVYPQLPPPIPLPGYMFQCRPKSFLHELRDVIYAAAGIGGFGGRRGAITGAGAGGYGANHEQDCYLVLLPPKP